MVVCCRVVNPRWCRNLIAYFFCHASASIRFPRFFSYCAPLHHYCKQPCAIYTSALVPVWICRFGPTEEVCGFNWYVAWRRPLLCASLVQVSGARCRTHGQLAGSLSYVRPRSLAIGWVPWKSPFVSLASARWEVVADNWSVARRNSSLFLVTSFSGEALVSRIGN